MASETRPRGMDISGHNPQIDWPTVREQSGLAFAFIKVTEGTGYVSPQFPSQWAGAKAAGLLRGAYHFFRWDAQPATQAGYFLAKLGQDRGELPLVVDVEAAGDGAGAMSYGADEAVRRLRVFVDAIKGATGRAPMIYTYPAVWRGQLGNPRTFTDCPLWIANYGVTKPDVPGGWDTYTFWQYSDRGSVAGVKGIVDVNMYNGTLDQLKALAGISVPPPAPQATGRLFPETGQTVAGGFLELWNRYGLPVMGYPLSGEYVDGDGYTRQDFENVIVEWREGEAARIGAAIRRLKYR